MKTLRKLRHVCIGSVFALVFMATDPPYAMLGLAFDIALYLATGYFLYIGTICSLAFFLMVTAVVYEYLETR